MKYNQEKAEQARQWAASDEGFKFLNDLAERVYKNGKQMEEDNRIDPESMRKPMTI